MAKSTAEGAKRMDCAAGFGTATMVTVTASFGFITVSILKKLQRKMMHNDTV